MGATTSPASLKTQVAVGVGVSVGVCEGVKVKVDEGVNEAVTEGVTLGVGEAVAVASSENPTELSDSTGVAISVATFSNAAEADVQADSSRANKKKTKIECFMAGILQAGFAPVSPKTTP